MIKRKEDVCEYCGKEAKVYWVYRLWLCDACSVAKRAERKSIMGRNTRSKNPITDLGNGYALMTLYNQQCIFGGCTIFDSKFMDEVSKYKWHLDANGYVSSGGNAENGFKRIKLHNLIAKPRPGYHIDHIDKEKRNNTLANLRECTIRENNFNRGKRIDNKSGVIGVYFDKSSDKWAAGIRCDGKSHTIGRYATKEEAIRARLKAEEKYYGEFAPQKHLQNVTATKPTSRTTGTDAGDSSSLQN